MKLSGLLTAGLLAILVQPADTIICNLLNAGCHSRAAIPRARVTNAKIKSLAVSGKYTKPIPAQRVLSCPTKIDCTQHLDMSNPVDRVAILISMNEGKPTTIDWNDNGYGISVGLFQANQKVGELPDLLKRLANKPEGRHQLNNAFGKVLAAKIEKNPEIIRNLNFRRNNWLGRGLELLVRTPVFRKSEIAMIREKVKRAAAIAKQHGIKSMEGVAVCADLTNQWGQAGAQRFLHASHDQHSQKTKVLAIVKAVAQQSIYGVRYFQDLQKAEALDLTSEPFSPDS